MIKKLFILVFLALPLGLAAQNLKFGTVNTVDVFNLMPEKATAEKQLEDLSKQYESEFMKMQEEFTTKYKDFVNSQDSMPENIKQRRMQEIQEIQQRIQNFREVATGDLEEQQAKLLAPLQEKIANAVKAVGQENGFTFTVTEVLAVAMKDQPGGLSEILKVLSEAELSLEYAYAFLLHKEGTACLILRVADNEAAEGALSAAGIKVATQEELF